MAWLDNRNQESARDLDRTIAVACRNLKRRDPVLSRLMAQHGPYRLETTTDYFQLMIETVISQQLSTKAARSIYNRLREAVGERSPRPRTILAAGDATLRSAGLSRSKAQYVRNVAEAFTRGRMGPKSFAKLDDEEVVARLTAIKGIGEWSAQMFLIFGLGRMDVFPVGDLGLRNAMVREYRMRRSGSLKRFHRIAEKWKPYRTVGTLYLWRSYDGL